MEAMRKVVTFFLDLMIEFLSSDKYTYQEKVVLIRNKITELRNSDSFWHGFAVGFTGARKAKKAKNGRNRKSSD